MPRGRPGGKSPNSKKPTRGGGTQARPKPERSQPDPLPSLGLIPVLEPDGADASN